MEEVKSRGPYIYSVLESAQAFLSQHPFEELEEPTLESKGLWSSHFFVLWFHSSSWAQRGWSGGGCCGTKQHIFLTPLCQFVPSPLAKGQTGTVPGKGRGSWYSP